MADWKQMPECGGVVEHRLRLTPEGTAPRYARVFEVLASHGRPAEYQAQYGTGYYVTRHVSVAEAKAGLERDPRVVAALAALNTSKGA